jgi:hypothetical protein
VTFFFPIRISSGIFQDLKDLYPEPLYQVSRGSSEDENEVTVTAVEAVDDEFLEGFLMIREILLVAILKVPGSTVKLKNVRFERLAQGFEIEQEFRTPKHALHAVEILSNQKVAVKLKGGLNVVYTVTTDDISELVSFLDQFVYSVNLAFAETRIKS